MMEALGTALSSLALPQLDVKEAPSVRVPAYTGALPTVPRLNDVIWEQQAKGGKVRSISVQSEDLAYMKASHAFEGYLISENGVLKFAGIEVETNDYSVSRGDCLLLVENETSVYAQRYSYAKDGEASEEAPCTDVAAKDEVQLGIDFAKESDYTVGQVVRVTKSPWEGIIGKPMVIRSISTHSSGPTILNLMHDPPDSSSYGLVVHNVVPWDGPQKEETDPPLEVFTKIPLTGFIRIKPTALERVKSDAEKAALRIGATQATNLVKKATDQTAAGAALNAVPGVVPFLLGLSLPALIQDERADTIGEELRVKGMTEVGNAVVDTLFQMLPPKPALRVEPLESKSEVEDAEISESIDSEEDFHVRNAHNGRHS